jgi:tRNA 2-(methylsulfanyl)-N6-isopentenyladenosine37 hydroxylase
MLGLQLATDARWAYLAEHNLAELLSDHAFCEHKAATNALTMIVHFPELTEMVEMLSQVAMEELEHFRQVHQLIAERGWRLGNDKKDHYVNELLKFVRKGINRETYLIDRLLFAAMIEARSCERFKLLANTIQDKALAEFYHQLMISEANHYTIFIKLAKKYATTIDVDHRWCEFLAFEKSVVEKYGNEPTMHG